MSNHYSELRNKIKDNLGNPVLVRLLIEIVDNLENTNRYLHEIHNRLVAMEKKNES